MGLVFKTSRTAARVVVGGFDSHVPPPDRGSDPKSMKKWLKAELYAHTAEGPLEGARIDPYSGPLFCQDGL